MCRIYNDPDVTPSDKLYPAINPNSGSTELPKSSHLETRVFSLLRQLEKVSSGLKRKRVHPDEASKRAASDAKFERLLEEDTLVIVRKLRTLQRKGAQMKTSLVVSKTRKYMETIGRQIDLVGQAAKRKAQLWDFVSRYTENSMSGDKLMQVYDKMMQEKKDIK